MAVNRYAAHILVLPEDDANRQLANGFITHVSVKPRAIQVLNPEGGWLKVLGKFSSSLLNDLRSYPEMHLVLLVDFDNDYQNRVVRFTDVCPPELKDRFYILGTFSEPETLKRSMNASYEAIGSNLVQDCLDGTQIHWSHGELNHNVAEITRLNQNVKKFLFK